jgi:hypothetical protein
MHQNVNIYLPPFYVGLLLSLVLEVNYCRLEWVFLRAECWRSYWNVRHINKSSEIVAFVMCTLHQIIQYYFQARSQNCEKRILASSCLSIRIELGSHWKDFHEIWYLSIFRKSVEIFQIPLKLRITGTLDEDPCKFMVVSRSVLLGMRNLSGIIVEKIDILCIVTIWKI